LQNGQFGQKSVKIKKIKKIMYLVNSYQPNRFFLAIDAATRAADFFLFGTYYFGR